jgi:hypothetical protein
MKVYPWDVKAPAHGSADNAPSLSQPRVEPLPQGMTEPPLRREPKTHRFAWKLTMRRPPMNDPDLAEMPSIAEPDPTDAKLPFRLSS